MPDLQKHGKTYSLHVYRGGVHQRINTGATTLRDARRAADRITALYDREKATRQLTAKLCEYALALARGELTREMLSAPLQALEAQAALEVLPVVAELFPAPPVSAAELWDRYISTKPEVKPVTLKTRRQRYAIFEIWAQERDMSHLSVADCRRFLASREGASGQTIKNYLSDLAVVFEAAGVENPWKTPGLRPKHVVHAETAAMELSAARKLLAFCDDHPDDRYGDIPLARWAAFLRAHYYSGLRPIDVCHFEYKDFNGVVIDMIPEKTSRTRRHVNYKADPLLRQLLDSLPHLDDRFYFPEFAAMYDRDRSKTSHYYSQIAAAAGIDPKYKLYSFRHGFATYAIDAGADETDVAAAIGHTTTATTTGHYYHGKKTVELPKLQAL
ncbi:MAG: site-specific integrase [Lentisphaeria bacterium]|nr:site-specific integrase [Lentisphaeria bacterium]